MPTSAYADGVAMYGAASTQVDARLQALKKRF